MHVKLQTVPDVLVLDGPEHEPDAVLVDPQVDYELENHGQHVHDAPLHREGGLLHVRLTAGRVRLAGLGGTGQKSHYLRVVVDLLFCQLRLGLVSDYVEISFLLLLLMRLYHLYIL